MVVESLVVMPAPALLPEPGPEPVEAQLRRQHRPEALEVWAHPHSQVLLSQHLLLSCVVSFEWASS